MLKKTKQNYNAMPLLFKMHSFHVFRRYNSYYIFYTAHLLYYSRVLYSLISDTRNHKKHYNYNTAESQC